MDFTAEDLHTILRALELGAEDLRYRRTELAEDYTATDRKHMVKWELEMDALAARILAAWDKED